MAVWRPKLWSYIRPDCLRAANWRESIFKQSAIFEQESLRLISRRWVAHITSRNLWVFSAFKFLSLRFCVLQRRKLEWHTRDINLHTLNHCPPLLSKIDKYRWGKVLTIGLLGSASTERDSVGAPFVVLVSVGLSRAVTDTKTMRTFKCFATSTLKEAKQQSAVSSPK
jgi:hypothetical protein